MSKKLDKNVKSIADNLKKEIMDGVKEGLGLEKFQAQLAEFGNQLKEKEVQAIEKVAVSKNLKKDVNELTDKEHVKAFAQAVLTRDHATLKTLTEGTDADGGYLVSDQVNNAIEKEMERDEDFRSLVTVKNMIKWKMRIPKELTMPQFYNTTEGGSKNTTSMTYDELYLTSKKKAAIIYLSDEFIDDADFNMTQEVINGFARAAQKEINETIIDGAGGTVDGDGLFNNASVGTTATVGSLNWSKIVWLESKVPAKFRMGASQDNVYIVASDVYRIMKQLVDGNDRPLWNNGNAQIGTPATFNGYRVVESDHVTAGEMLFGNTKEAAWYGQRQPMTVKISNDTTEAFTKDKTAVRVVMRHDQQIIWPRAIYKYTGVTA